ncbi:MAG: ribonuclease [Clostridia bacterium]|nr:ribonuclease [Clostridia bacterium]
MNLIKKHGLRWLALALTLIAALSFAGCGSELLDTLELAEDVLELAGEVLEDTTAAPETTLPPETTKAPETTSPPETTAPPETEAPIDENGSYDSKNDVALYIHTYGHLPDNYITKSEARKLGWEGGSLETYAPGCAIGGDTFGNYEGLLPKKSGRTWTECDIDTIGESSRGAKRIVFSNDGLIYYTDDHYESFTLLYGEE